MNALKMAVAENKLQQIEMDINQKSATEVAKLTDLSGCHLLHWAAANGRVDVCQCIIARGGLELVNIIGGSFLSMLASISKSFLSSLKRFSGSIAFQNLTNFQ